VTLPPRYAWAQLSHWDDAEQLLGAGKFYLLTGDPITAIGAFQASFKLGPGIPARYYLAYAKAQQGRLDEARQILAAIPPSDFQYANAQKLLKALTVQ
jgi:tetratricopeptide (TPR) repeat protein